LRRRKRAGRRENHPQQFLRRTALQEKGVSPNGEGFRLVSTVEGQYNHLDIRKVALDDPRRFQPIEAWHTSIHQDYIRATLFHQMHRLGTTAGLADPLDLGAGSE